MKTILLPLALVAVAGTLLAVWLLGGPDQATGWRRDLRSGVPERQRAALRAIAAARDLDLLNDVARLWEQILPSEGFQRRQFRPGSLQPDIHACFLALGKPAAERLVERAERDAARFTACLVGAGVALDGTASTELGPGGAQTGGIAVRAYRFRFGATRLRVPNLTGDDESGRLEAIRAWRAHLASLP